MLAAATQKRTRILYLFAALFYAGAAPSSPQTIKEAFAVPSANPNVISAGAPASVSVTVRISGAPGEVSLERLSSPDATRGTVIAELRGKDGVYSAQVQFTESSAGTIILQVAAARLNVRSQIFRVRVLPAQLRGGTVAKPSGAGVRISAGAAAAAEFAKHHQEHYTDQQTWESVQRFGLIVRYPSAFKLNTTVPNGGPIALNTFLSQYSEKGGHFPTGGAEVDISYWPKPSGSTQQIMNTDLQESDDQNIDAVPFKVDGTKATRASFTDDFQGRLAHRTIAVYVEHGGGLYKFFLTYHKDDPLGPAFISDFEEILKNVRFSQ